MSNLIANAIHHGKPDGAIDVQLRASQDVVTLRVHNQRPAIPDKLLPSIFDPFRRQAGHGSPSTEGLGLGLYICRELIRAHSGEISVQSSDETGTSFVVRLPRSAKPQAAFAR